MDIIDDNSSKIIGKALLYAAIQASIGGIEMSSKFDIMNFSKDQETLQYAVIALRNYIMIGSIWTVGTVLSLYSTHGLSGAFLGLSTNIAMMSWIILSYIATFKEVATKYKLYVPRLF